jgi:energy-coupling factor transporter ATP-binding protein EcfA2
MSKMADWKNHPVVEIRDLSFTYAGSHNPALTGINLSLFPNELTILIGPTGCGKSTLALCLNGLIPHVVNGEMTGQVTVDGFDTRAHPVYEMATRVGLLFQDPEAQLCHLYGEDEIAFGCENLKVEREAIIGRTDELAEALGIKDTLHTPVHTLSLGQKQRIALAAVLAMKPRLLVLDEPMSNLDPQSGIALINTIDRLRREQNMAVLIIEHRIDELVGIADRVIVLDEGKVVFQGSPRQVFGQNLDRFVSRLGRRVPEICQLILALRERGIKIKECPLTVEEACNAIAKPAITYQIQSPDAPERDRPVLLEVNGLNLRYWNSQFMLKDINLRVHEGEFLAIVGPNGAGKTTLARSIIGLLKPISGRILIDGRDVSRLPVYERAKTVGYVFQEPENHFVRDKVVEEIEFGWRQLEMGARERRKETESLLLAFGLTGYEDTFVYQLSMGQKKNLSIATMLGLGQQALIIDEPTMGLDWEAAQNLVSLLKRLNRENGLIIMVITHNMRLVTEACNRVIAMSQGRIIYDGHPHGLFTDTKLLQSVGLIAPPVWRLSQQLRQNKDVQIQPALNIAEFIEQVKVA